jgi:hypothetical protein
VSNAEKQPTGHGPQGCDENGPAAALLVGYVSIQICALLAPCRRPILIATKAMLLTGQDTSMGRPRASKPVTEASRHIGTNRTIASGNFQHVEKGGSPLSNDLAGLSSYPLRKHLGLLGVTRQLTAILNIIICDHGRDFSRCSRSIISDTPGSSIS